MAENVEKQERYSALVDAKLRATIVQKDGIIWNNRYEGNPKAGLVKIPVRDTEVAVSVYDKVNGIAASQAKGTFLPVAIDKDYAVNEIIDGFDAEAVPDNLVADRLDSAGYSLGLQMNSDSTAELLKGGTILADTTALTKASVYDCLVDTRTTLSVNKIPTTGRWVLVTPVIYALLLKSPEFIKASNLGDMIVQTGAVGQIAGFTVYEDVTLPAAVDYIAGHSNWCTRVKEWEVPPYIADLKNSDKFVGASAVKGRMIYAHKVTKAAAVIIKKNAA